MSPFQKFLDRFRPVVTIHAEAGEVIFQSGTDEERAQPLIRVAENGKIMAVGEVAATADAGRLIRLLGPDSANDDHAIRAFLRYQLALTISGANPLKPHLTIVEPTFRRTFGRQAAGVLLRALRADGFSADIVEAN